MKQLRVWEGGPLGGCSGGLTEHSYGNLMFVNKGKLLFEEKFFLSLA